MRVAILTTEGQRYHRYLCAQLAMRHRVVAVVYPSAEGYNLRGRLQGAWNGIKRFGVGYQLLRELAQIKLGWDVAEDLRCAELRLMPFGDDDYVRVCSAVERRVDNINGAEGVRLLRELDVQAVVCSGGPIYSRELIESVPLMLNYHTGISPIYNGFMTAFWAYANAEPGKIGGTLMLMSERIDGGAVLAHYLPSIETHDTPGSLFVKSIIGGVSLYDRVLADWAAGRQLMCVPQGKARRVYKSYQWTVYQRYLMQLNVRERICASNVRPEQFSVYWNSNEQAIAREKMREFLTACIYSG